LGLIAGGGATTTNTTARAGFASAALRLELLEASFPDLWEMLRLGYRVVRGMAKRLCAPGRVLRHPF